jgi:hypothetical protein
MNYEGDKEIQNHCMDEVGSMGIRISGFREKRM